MFFHWINHILRRECSALNVAVTTQLIAGGRFMEQLLAKACRDLIAGLPVGANLQEQRGLRNLLECLNYFIPSVLAEVHREWEYESLDGVYGRLALKTGDVEADFRGFCIFISDQVYTPFQVRMQISPTEDKLTYFECRIGQRGKRGTPYITGSSKEQLRQIHALEAETIDWTYHVAFGKREG
jgi:hypothetical protein